VHWVIAINWRGPAPATPLLDRTGQDSLGSARTRAADATFRMTCSSFPSRVLLGLCFWAELTASEYSLIKSFRSIASAAALRSFRGTGATLRSYRKIYQRASSGGILAIDHNRAAHMTMQATAVLRPVACER